MSNRIIHKYLGIPFKSKGEDRKGCDCWGLLKMIYKNEYGIDLGKQFDIAPGDSKRIINAISEEISQKQWKKVENPMDGDGVALSCGKHVHHVGVFFLGGVLHASEKMGVVYNRTHQLKLYGFNKVEYYRYAV